MLVKTKADSSLPRKRLEPQQGPGDKPSFCLERKLGKCQRFSNSLAQKNVSTNTQPNFTDTTQGNSAEKRGMHLLRETRLN